MDREALLIYLKNIYNLEMLKVTLEKRYNDSKSNYDQCRNAVYEKWKLDLRILIKPKNPPTVRGSLIFFIVMTFVYILLFFIGTFMGVTLVTILMLWGVCLFGIISIVMLYQYYEEKALYEQKCREYEESVVYNNAQKLKEPALMQQRKNELAPIVNKWEIYRRKWDAEYSRTDRLLQEAYNINIIPAQYRNISSIYYIYQWMSTSQSSLEFVLLHTHIEDGIRRIEAKLDTIIDQNSQIIIQNRRREANDRARTNQILNSLNQIECNSADSAYYNQIAANYSRTSAFFSEATFWNSLFR